MAKPFVKWAGGKTQILDEIRARYPAELGQRINKYAEPFVGGGAVLFDILSNFTLNEVYISDINQELITTYLFIRDNVNALIHELEQLESIYRSVESEERKKIYYEARLRFNYLKTQGNQSIEIATLFIFLNRTCFNGLYRVNSKGEFNVPQGSYKNPCICDEKNLVKVSNLLQNVDIVCGDYTLAENFIDEVTFVYFDPPYRPLTATASFCEYSKNGFDDNAQIALANFIDRMSDNGAHIIASNSDPKNIDVEDDFFDNIYARHNISRIEANRAINSAVQKRGKIRELIIANM